MKIDLSQKRMRKTSKEITERAEIDDIIKNSLVCRLAMCKNNIPYIVPVSFGYDGKDLYLHTAIEGRKIDFWETNPLICFEFDKDVKTIKNKEKACKWSVAYKSVIGYGKIEELTSNDEKIVALNQIMLHYSGKKWEFEVQELKSMRVWKIWILEMSGKKSDID